MHLGNMGIIKNKEFFKLPNNYYVIGIPETNKSILHRQSAWVKVRQQKLCRYNTALYIIPLIFAYQSLHYEIQKINY